MKTPFFLLAAVLLPCSGVNAAVVEVAMTSNPETFEFRGDAASDHLGNATAQAVHSIATGDLNGDGLDDMVFGSEDEGTLGAVHIVFGRASWSSSAAYMAGIADVKIPGISGEKVSSSLAIGDVNGDSIGDLILGSMNADNGTTSNCGAVYIYFGATSWASSRTLASANVKILGDTAGGNVGYSVAVGDVNGDGIQDVIASAPGQDTNGLTNNGQVFAFFGASSWSSSLTVASASVTIHGPRTNTSPAICVWTGDVNGDGCDDLFFGAYHDDDPNVSFAGYSGVVTGLMGRSNSGWSSVSPVSATSSNVDFYTYGVSTIYGLGYRGTCGDVNGDDIEDMIVLATDSPSPRTVIFYGGSSFAGSVGPVNTLSSYTIDYGNPNNNNGVPSALDAADFDADGLDDIAVGFATSSPGGSLFAGSVTIHYGRSSWEADEVDDLKYTGEASSDYLGMAVAMGDTNGDGAADLLFNAPYADPPSRSAAGKIYLISGTVATPPTMAFAMSGSSLSFDVSTRSGQTLRLEHTTDFITWTEVSTTNSDGSALNFNATASGTAGFYRVVVNPAPTP